MIKPSRLTTAPVFNRQIAQSIWDTCEERDELKRENARLRENIGETTDYLDDLLQFPGSPMFDFASEAKARLTGNETLR